MTLFVVHASRYRVIGHRSNKGRSAPSNCGGGSTTPLTWPNRRTRPAGRPPPRPARPDSVSRCRARISRLSSLCYIAVCAADRVTWGRRRPFSPRSRPSPCRRSSGSPSAACPEVARVRRRMSCGTPRTGQRHSGHVTHGRHPRHARPRATRQAAHPSDVRTARPAVAGGGRPVPEPRSSPRTPCWPTSPPKATASPFGSDPAKADALAVKRSTPDSGYKMPS